MINDNDKITVSIDQDGSNDSMSKDTTNNTKSMSKVETNNGGRRSKWSRFIIGYSMVSIQFAGLLSSLIIDSIRKDYGLTIYRISIVLCMVISSELNVRVFNKLQLNLRSKWITMILTMVFGNVSSINNQFHQPHRHGHHGHGGTGSIGSGRSFLLTFFAIFCNLGSFFQHLKENKSSRRIFIFLSLNFAFMFVEFIWGYWSNSLAIGLFASYLGSPHSSSIRSGVGIGGIGGGMVDPYHHKFLHSFGHGRIKVLSGFINGIFLIYIGVSVLIEAFERILHPPHIHADQLMVVSVLGLVVNLVGLVFFHDAHMAGHGHGHDHGHDHGHSHGHDHHGHGGHGYHHHHGHGHAHGHGHGHDHNMRGIFLHVLADTLGSVAVIVSSVIIYFWELFVFDALCSVFISILIFMTVYPLISETSKILLEETPNHIINALKTDLSMVLSVPHVVGYRLPHFWEYERGRIVGTIHIQIEEDKIISSNNNKHNNKNNNKNNSNVNNKNVHRERERVNSQEILSQLTNIFVERFGMDAKDLTIQLEKQQFLDQIDPIHHSVYNQFVRVHNNRSKIIAGGGAKQIFKLPNNKHSKHTKHSQHAKHSHSHNHNHHNHHHDHDHNHDEHDHGDGHSHGHSHGNSHSGISNHYHNNIRLLT